MTSISVTMTVGPAVAAVSLAAAKSRSAAMTVGLRPSEVVFAAAKASVTARPIPDPAPVTRTTVSDIAGTGQPSETGTLPTTSIDWWAMRQPSWVSAMSHW